MSAQSLYAVHEASGARFVEWEGRKVPADYGDADAEYQAVRESAGLIDRSARGKVRVTGADRARFLHGMLTNTVEQLAEGEGNHAALTNPKGQTLADVHVYNRGNAVVLETEPGVQEKVIAALDRYLIADDVKMEDVTDALAILGVQGPRAGEVVGRALDGFRDALPDHHTAAGAFGGAEVVLAARDYTGESGYDLWVEAGRAVALWEVLRGAGGQPVGHAALEVLRVEAGIPRYGVDVDESMAPLEAGLAHTVSFTKGCYIGQEVIAKMKNLGNPRRYLVGLRVPADAPPPAGTPVLADGRNIGRVTSSIRSPALEQVLALASVRRGFEAAGTEVLLGEDTRAEVVALPFYQKRERV